MSSLFITVTDGQYNRSSPEQKFSIRVIPVNNMPPQFGSHISEILVSQGGSVPIGQSQLQISDPDTPLSELRMSVEENPVNGVIEKVQDGLKVLLRKGNVIFFLIFRLLFTNAI